jgi:O-antigen ligase
VKRDYSAILLPVLAVVSCLFPVYLAIFQPGYLNNTYLEALIFFQVVVAAAWRYRQRYFPLLILVFVWAGTDVPLNTAWTSGRWFVLLVGALIGFVIYMKDRSHHFTVFHLAALFCVLSALVSAVVSSYPQQAVLKALSLLLLFLYGAAGARLAVAGREDRFFPGLLLSCEVLAYVTAVAYFVFHLAIFDNPNSLGAVMGVVIAPLLLWGVLISEEHPIRQRRVLAFLLSVVLLFFSSARAGIFAGVVSCILLCAALRRYQLLAKVLGTAVLAVLALVVLVPQFADQTRSFTADVLYKGHREEGVLGSRRSPWQKTLAVIEGHPWFGSGFGTSITQFRASGAVTRYESAPQALREHGNSYLEIAEWVGLLGVLPFVALLLQLSIHVGRVLAWARRTGNARHVAIPMASILVAGLIHAIFEDWLFAVGYYLCVFFWAIAFAIVDFLPRSETANQPVAIWTRRQPVPGYLAAVSNQ